MAKAVKAVGTAIMIVGAVVATGGMALAMGAGVGLLGSASLATSAVLSVGSFSVSAGALLSVGTLVSSIGGSLAQPKVSSAGGALGWVGDPNGPLHFAAGRIAVGGDLRHKAAYGPNDRMYFSAVTVVSDAGPIEAFESFTANDIAVTFDASGKANSSYYANVMWRRTQLGFQPEGSYLASPSGLEGGASLPNWGASHKLSGKAAFILTLSENSKQSAYKGQYPKPRTIIRGLRVYDWRRDSTYPGGSGPQRLNDPSTWAYSANPILWSVKWLLGLWEGPTGKGAPQVDYQVGGIGTRWENIDIAAFTEAANIADTHGWTCAAWPSTDDDKAQVLDAFLQAGGAYYIERAGKASCIHRAAPRVSVATITAADTAGPIELDTSASYLDRKNTGVATYLSEADGWKMTALPEVSSSQWVTEDGGRKRSVPVTYSYVDKVKQAAELICLGLAHTREGISGRIPLKSYMQGIGPGSAFTITEPEFVLDGLKCLCLETSYDANTGVHTVTFVSETDAKYPYAYGQAPNPPAPPALTPVDPTHVSPPQPGDWTIIPRPPAPGGQLPVIDLSGIVSNATADAMLINWREVAEGEDPTAQPPFMDEEGELLPGWVDAGVWPPTTRTLSIQGPQPGAQIWIAIRYKRGNNVSPAELAGPITVGDLIAGDTTHLDGEPVQDVLDRLTDTATLADQNRQAVEALEEVYGDTASAAASAAAAAASEAAATQAKADALIAKGEAQASATTAATRATDAAGSASAALTSKNDAAASATTATQKATDAAGSAATATQQAGLAAGSATAAGGSATAAAGSASTAATKATEAGNSATAANAAKVAAESARDTADQKATAAASSASSAATSATAAGTSASAAQTAKTAAETARAGAETAQTSAANSATTATGAAATATTQAGIATTAKNDAQAASNAAVTAKNQASSFADAAGVSAAASQASSVSATSARDGAIGAAIQSIPFTPSSEAWTNFVNTGGAPQSRASAPSQYIVDGTIAPPVGNVQVWGPKQYVRWEEGRVYELTMEVSAPVGNPESYARFVFGRFDAAYTSVANATYTGTGQVSAEGRVTIKRRYGLGFAPPGGTAISRGSAEWLSIGVQLNINPTGGAQSTSKQTLHTFSWKDITAQAASETSASAAATSASSAAASDAAAGQAASAATAAKTQAETARGQAQTAATQASNSRDDAAGSAASASTSATNAANSRDAAAGSASAAAGSASTATTKATEAGNSAAAAQASQVAATAAKDGAETARGQAQSSASAASTSASSAAASATTAGEKATAAAGSATTAATRAGEALAYRNQAASSASDAAGSASTASTASGTAVAARNDAQAAAATAVAQSSSASASAASAQLAANLAAQVGQGGGYHRNPTWADWGAGALPPGGQIWGAATTARNTASARYGACLEVTSADGSNGGVQLLVGRFVTPGPVAHVVVEYEVLLQGGSFRRSGLQASIQDGGSDRNAIVHLFDEHGVGVEGQTYTGAKLIKLPVAAANPNGLRLYLFNNFSSLNGGSGGAKNLKWQRVNVRAPTSAEIETGTVLPAVQAQASLALSTAVDALTQLGQAAFELILASGNIPAYIKALAEPGGSEIAFAATKLLLRNVVGDQIVTALELINGEAYFGAPVSVDISGRRLTIGPGFGVSNGLVLWFGPNTIVLSAMSRTNGYFALGTDGKVYYGSGELNPGAAMEVISSEGSVIRSRTGNGFIESGTVSFVAQNAVGPVQFQVTRIAGDAAIDAFPPSSTDNSAPFVHSMNFSANLTTLVLGATYLVHARDSMGRNATAQVYVEFTRI
ncbi:hypothetical protein NI456_01300 [Brevundimonas diminuta]|uniref:hypothetical protein n=1 Tax=Brevundimonas diminuta TaxID=293 RepID=UPI002097DA5E|nr:hypothetical protein [Brevundimonas diminuta]MCO8017484.1 hypothetical protein [Brevundimonas diminuta]MCO8021004.1 hypothetical protein [Brevundimonas diminuta]